jgi:hypothetical protein
MFGFQPDRQQCWPRPTEIDGMGMLPGPGSSNHRPCPSSDRIIKKPTAMYECGCNEDGNNYLQAYRDKLSEWARRQEAYRDQLPIWNQPHHTRRKQTRAVHTSPAAQFYCLRLSIHSLQLIMCHVERDDKHSSQWRLKLPLIPLVNISSTKLGTQKSEIQRNIDSKHGHGPMQTLQLLQSYNV